MALGILNAECSCEFDSSENCICTVTGEAQVDSAGNYFIMVCYNVDYCYTIFTAQVSYPSMFEYSGWFDNTTPKASQYTIRLAKSGEEDFIGSSVTIEPKECDHCPTPTCSLRIN